MTPAGIAAAAKRGVIRAAVLGGHQEAAGHRRVGNHLPARSFPRESLRDQICGRLRDTPAPLTSSDRDAFINLAVISSHRPEGDDPPGGRQLSWCNSDCSVVNKN